MKPAGIKSFALGPNRAGVAAIFLALFSGCSASTDSTTAETRLPSTQPKPAAVTSLPPATTESKSASSEKSGNVAVQLVTPDEFKKIVADQKGKVVLVDFWATYCAPCRAKFPKTLELAKKLGPQGFSAISMSMDDPKEQAKVLHFLQEQNAEIINLTNKLDDTEAAFGALDIDGGALPHYKIFDRKGNLRRKFGGDPDHPFDEKDIEKEVLAALKEK
jgi:thiol-disulfide isomerase/thioredoxin